MTLELSDNATYILKQRYLRKNEKREIIETPEQLFNRVAHAIAQVEKQYNKTPEEIQELEERFLELLTSLKFLANSPTLMNAGTDLGVLSACFVLPVEDNMESIMDGVKNSSLIHKEGGGTGFDFSNLRPKGDVVGGSGGVASGPVSFLRIYNAVTDVIKQGGKRRGANMGVLHYWHPDIEDFITCKEKEGNYSNFNISVGVDDKFMSAVANDKDIELINPRTGNIMREVRARSIWNLILIMAWRNGEPGILFFDHMNEFNPTPELGEYKAVNPCITGDSLIAVAEGRGEVPIKKLAEEGKDVPVYCSDPEGYIHIRMGRNPRLTRRNARVLDIMLDDGSIVHVTPDHKMLLSNGSEVSASELKPGDSLLRFDKYQFCYSSKNTKYWGIQRARRNTYQEHRLIKEFEIGRYLDVTETIHHKNFDSLDNSSSNLMIVSPEEHSQFHDISSDNNPVRRFPERNIFNNPDFQRKIREEYHIGAKRSKETCRKIGAKTRERFKDSEFRKKHSQAARKAMEKAKHKLEGPRVEKINLRCPVCNKRFSLLPSEYKWRKEHNKTGIYCSYSCSNRGRYQNHRVVSIKESKKADLYNLTVDEFHNFVIVTSNEKNKKSGIIVRNCGEQPLLPWEACNLGSINLSKFISEGRIKWKELEETVRLAVRFLDNVIDASRFPISQIDKMVKGNRKIGLGVMGWHDFLILKGVRYDSEEALQLARDIMKFITKSARDESIRLGKEKGSFPNKEKSIFKDEEYMRNATVTTIAPTGTISIIANTSQGIEPLFALEYIRNVKDSLGKNLSEYAPLIKDLLKEYNVRKISTLPEKVKNLLVTANDIAPLWHVKMQAAFQKYTDNAVSKTVNLPNSSTINDIETIFLEAYRLGCKGITVYRDGSRNEQLLTKCPECEDTACLINEKRKEEE